MIELKEHSTIEIEKSRLTDETGELLWRQYSDQISVEFPTPRTNNQWKLTNQGWVGQIPLPDGDHVWLTPKVTLANLFGMLEYAYQLKSFKFLDGLIESDSIEDVYSHLAGVLARNVMDRARAGLYRNYISDSDIFPYVRGRIDVAALIRQPCGVNLQCQYQDFTANIMDNQILAFTLSRIAMSGVCEEDSLQNVRKAFRILSNAADTVPCRSSDCVNRLYNRLNSDYHPLHALCRFFLEHSGPSADVGDHTMLPFLVNMPRLYEQFVAEWLKANLPDHLRLASQMRVDIDTDNSLHFDVDLVVVDSVTDCPLVVCDTKYKATDKPSSSDIQQIVAYAYSLGCDEAVLLYPFALGTPVDTRIKGIRVRSLAFSLEGGIDDAGNEFLAKVLDTETAFVQEAMGR